MIHNRNKEQQTGFTILEVLIVIAIAGLILLILFIAMPAVGRASANHRRKTDVSVITSAFLTYVTNSNNNLPADCSGNPGPFCTTTFLSGDPPAYYQPENISFKFRSDTLNDGFPDYTSPGNLEWITIANYYRCTIDAGGAMRAVHSGASYRDVVIIYELQTINGVLPECRKIN